MSFFEQIETENDLSASLTETFRQRPYVSIYILGQKVNYPAANVLHDICEFSLDRPSGAPDNYRIYTPTTDTYGLRVVSTSANDTLAGTGVQRVKIHYLDTNWELQSVEVDMNGTTPVTAVASGVRRVNDFHSLQTGTLSVSGGDISLETTGTTPEAPWTGRQTLGFINTGGNKDMTAVFTVPENKEIFAYEINVSSSNQDQSVRLRSNTDPITRELIQANCFLFQSVDFIGSNNNATQSLDYLRFPSRADIKISSSPTATSADSSCHLVMAMIDKTV